MDHAHLADLVGSAAGFLTTISFLPQVIKTWRSRSTGDLSVMMFLAYCLGLVLWLIYGLLTRSWPVIIANVATLVLAGTVLAMVVGFRLRRTP